jgi:hypothetical protein
MGAVKEAAFSAVFQLDRIYACDAFFVDTECTNDLGAYFSPVRPCGAASFVIASAFRKFPAFHRCSPLERISIKPVSVDGL